MTIDNPLVSIVVLAYNSENTILETLVSLKKQTYKNIEIIVADDASKDNTIDVVEKWAYKNKQYVKISYFTSAVNKGIPENMNKGVFMAKGEWIKIIAADDILLHDCIENNLNYINNNNEIINFLYSDLIKFTVDENNKERILDSSSARSYMLYLSKYDSEKQYKKLLRKDILLSPTLFFRKKIYEKLGGADLSIKTIEDWPLRLKITKAGEKLFFLDKKTVKYRIHNSVSNKVNEVYKINQYKIVCNLKKKLCYPNIPKYDIFYWVSELSSRIKFLIITKFMKNRPSNGTKIVIKFFNCFSVYSWRNIIYKTTINIKKKNDELLKRYN